MSPLYLFNNKLLIKNNKLANNSDCCCFVCKITRCGCEYYQYNETYSQLWIDIQNWITSENYTCNGDPVNCGAWEPKLINGVPQRDCCSQACYDIWEHILSHVGYNQETIDSKSPAELDVLCTAIVVEPTFFPTDKNNPNNDLFDSISYNDRFWVTRLDVSHKAGQLGDPCLPDPGETLCQNTFFTQSLAPVTFATLVGNDSLTADIDSNALDLLKTGSCLPHEKTSNYTNVNDCRNCYGALYKLGTYDQFGRYDPTVVYDCGTEQESPFIEASLISSDTNTTTFEFKVIDQLFYPCFFNPLCCCFDEAIFIGTLGCDGDQPLSSTYTTFGDGQPNSVNKIAIYLNIGNIPIKFKSIDLAIVGLTTNSTHAKLSIYDSTSNNPQMPGNELYSRNITVPNGISPFITTYPLLSPFTLNTDTGYWLIIESLNYPFRWYHNSGGYVNDGGENESDAFGGGAMHGITTIYYPTPNPEDAVPPNPLTPKKLAFSLVGTFKVPRPTKLTISDCMSKKFPGANPINPYGILTDQLSGPNGNTLINTETGDTTSYFEFDLSYKYEISWDNIIYYPFTNRWRVKYGPQRIGFDQNTNPSFSFVGLDSNYYGDNIPEPIGATIDSLDFNPITISTNIDIIWDKNVLIGDSNCSFVDIPLSEIGNTRSQPTLTINYTGPGDGCTFTPILQQNNEQNGSPYWSVSEVNINGIGSGYINNEILLVSTAPEDITEIPAILRLQTTLTEIQQPEINATVNSSSTNPAILSVITEQYQGDPKRWRVNDIIISSSGSGYNDGVYDINFEVLNNSTEETPATALAVTERVIPNFSYSIVTETGEGASLGGVSLNLARNSKGQKVWNFDYYVCVDGFYLLDGGTGYSGGDYISLHIDSEDALLDEHFNPGDFGISQFQPKEWRIPITIDENGTIIDINNGEIFNTQGFYIPTGKIEKVILINSLGGQNTCSHSYPSNNPELYGGSYYKEISGGIPTEVLIDDGGKYYRNNLATIRAVSGPCINNINMDIWHPGPCGISSGLITETSMNTPWEGINGSDGRIDGIVFSSSSGNFTEDLTDKYLLISDGSKYLKYKIEEYVNSTSLEIAPILNGDPLMNQTEDREYHIDGTYYADLIENVYRKFWLYYSDKNNPRSFDNYICPCCGPVDLILGVVKLEGCENFTIDKNYDIPLTQWEIDFNYCDILTRSNIYVRTCNNNNYRYNCCLPIDNCGDNPTDYRNNGYPCVYNNSDNCPPRIEIASQGGLFNLQNIAITCENMPSNYWDNCAVITKENAPWKKTDINCP